MKTLISFLLVSCLIGCDEDDSRIKVTRAPELSPRFRIETQGTFDAGNRSGNPREVLIIKDMLTGKEYLGITGVGVSEMHSEGKSGTHER
jgi:hypothetical protein